MAVALKEAEIKELLERAEHGTINPFTFAELYSIPATVEGTFEAFERAADILDGKAFLPNTYAITRRYLNSGTPEVRPLALHEMGGKIRVASLHPAEEVMVARRLTQLWLNQLGRLITTRSMLRNEEVVLSRQSRDSVLFSADLSAATDYIPHELAQDMARNLCQRLKRPWDVPVAEKIFSAKRLPDGTTSKRGIHMGLGPSWTILSLLNGFAAWSAGARKDTYCICGDDLIGFWPRKLQLRYITILEEMGLVVNRTKSFSGRRGVFCERLVVVTGDGKAHAQDVGHLSDLTAGKLLGGYSRSALSVADGLGRPLQGVIKAIGDRTRRRLIPRSIGPGRVRHGGNGFGRLSNNALLMLARFGSVDLCPAAPLPSAITAELNEVGEMQGEVPISKLLVTLRASRQVRDYLDNRTRTPPMTGKEAYRRRVKLNGLNWNPTAENFRAAVLSSQLRSRDKKTALMLLHRGIPSINSKARRRLENVLDRPRAERFVSRSVAEAMLLEIGPLELELPRNERIPLIVPVPVSETESTPHRTTYAVL